MMSKKFHGDVRPLSHDTRYMDGGFVGSVDDAIAQARAARKYPQHARAKVYNAAGRRLSRDRIALLQHLNLVPL